jgi:predicted transcriptional regulator
VTQRFKVLKALARRAGAGWAEVTNPRIAEDAGLRSAASVAAYLSSLDRDGLIERQGFSRERRIRVTEKGRAALGEASAGPAEPQGPEAAPEPTPEPAPEPPPEPAGPSGAPDTARYSRGPSEGARLIRAKRAHPPAPFRVPPIGTGPGRPVDGDLDETRRIVLEAIDELREAGRDAGEGDRPGLYRLDRESATPRQLVNAANGLRFKRGEPALALPDPDPVTNRRGASSLAGF